MKAYKEIVLYLIFGVLTTLVNITVYILSTDVLFLDYKVSTTLAWIVSVSFAYVTNKFLVFANKNKALLNVTKEFLFFVFFRLLSYVLDIVSMILLFEILNFDDLVSKIIANVIVILFNYVASKLFIFKKQKLHRKI